VATPSLVSPTVNSVPGIKFTSNTHLLVSKLITDNFFRNSIIILQEISHMFEYGGGVAPREGAFPRNHVLNSAVIDNDKLL